jgi:hypothetical protein
MGNGAQLHHGDASADTRRSFQQCRRLRALQWALRQEGRTSAPSVAAPTAAAGAPPPRRRCLRLGAFDLAPGHILGQALPSVVEKYQGGFYEIWARLFEHCRLHSTSTDLGGTQLTAVELVRYSPVDRHYPTAKELGTLDGIVISGSGEDAWDDKVPWLVELRAKIVEYDALRVKMSGFSFGPQVLLKVRAILTSHSLAPTSDSYRRSLSQLDVVAANDSIAGGYAGSGSRAGWLSRTQPARARDHRLHDSPD